MSVENDHVRVTVLVEGGHVAEMLHKKQGVSPLWVPPWPTAEPSTYRPELHPEYGLNSESKLLMGIMGHNLCLDMFGPPSDDEAEAGLTVHGEGSVVRYKIQRSKELITMSASLPLTGLGFERTLSLDNETVIFNETVTNLTALDKPIAWTQHVTLGPPFIYSGTEFTFPAEKSRTFEDPSLDGGVLAAATDFAWPNAPLKSGGTISLSAFGGPEPFSRFTTHLMAPGKHAGFAAFSPEHQLLIGYQWARADFPWLGLWQENKKRDVAPWNNRAVTCGFEFGVSPFPEPRRSMISRLPVFETPGYRWLPALGSAQVTYKAFLHSAAELSGDGWR